jgi:hypothetical protein
LGCWVSDKTGTGHTRWRASSYEVTASGGSGFGPGTVDESFAGQHGCGSRLEGQTVPGVWGYRPAGRRWG